MKILSWFFFQKLHRPKPLKKQEKFGFLVKTELIKHVFTEVVPLILYSMFINTLGKKGHFWH